MNRALAVLAFVAIAAGARAQERIGPDALRAAGALAPGDGVLARVDGAAIQSDELLQSLFAVRTELVFAALEQAVRRRVLAAEAERLGVTVPREALDAETDRVLDAQAQGYKLEAGPDRSFEAYVQERYGITPDVYREVIRRQVLEQMLLARTVRFEARTHDRIQVRLIVVKDLELARELRSQLADGANFAALARQKSVDSSGQNGGLLAPVAVDTPHPLFAGLGNLDEGAVSEISTLDKDGVTLFRLARLEKRLPADRRPYGEQAKDVEADLQGRPVESLELSEWDRRARAGHVIEVHLGRA